VALKHQDARYRARQDVYRIVRAILDAQVIVEEVRVGRRGGVRRGR
jgi:hypothetical protein